VVKLQPDVCALRFFYAKTLERPFLPEDIPFPRKAQQLPLILSREEVAQILTAPEHLKSRALLMTIYAARLRRSEVARLRVQDIDSARMTITVHQGKGQKDRVVITTLNRMMTGWANYFCLGPVSHAYRAIERHARRRLRQWLCAKHKLRWPATKRYPEAALHQKLGLVQLSTRRASFPWATS
jgi:integrase